MLERPAGLAAGVAAVATPPARIAMAQPVEARRPVVDGAASVRARITVAYPLCLVPSCWPTPVYFTSGDEEPAGGSGGRAATVAALTDRALRTRPGAWSPRGAGRTSADPGTRSPRGNAGRHAMLPGNRSITSGSLKRLHLP